LAQAQAGPNIAVCAKSPSAAADFLAMGEEGQESQMAFEPSGRAKARQLLEDSRSYMHEDLTKAQDTAAEARGICRRLGEVAMEAEAIQCVVAVLSLRGDFDEATREAYEALNICKKASNDEATAAALSVVVAVHFNSLNREDLDKNSDFFKEGVKELLEGAQECIRGYKKVKDRSGQASALIKLAQVQMLAEQPDAAKLSADWAYMLYNQEKDGNGFYNACLTLVYAHIMRLDFASASRYANEAKDICYQFQDSDGMQVVEELRYTISQCTQARSERDEVNKKTMFSMMKMNFH